MAVNGERQMIVGSCLNCAMNHVCQFRFLNYDNFACKEITRKTTHPKASLVTSPSPQATLAAEANVNAMPLFCTGM